MENENVIGKVCFAILRKGFVAGLRISLELDSPGCIIGCKFDGAGIVGNTVIDDSDILLHITSHGIQTEKGHTTGDRSVFYIGVGAALKLSGRRKIENVSRAAGACAHFEPVGCLYITGCFQRKKRCCGDFRIMQRCGRLLCGGTFVVACPRIGRCACKQIGGDGNLYRCGGEIGNCTVAKVCIRTEATALGRVLSALLLGNNQTITQKLLDVLNRRNPFYQIRLLIQGECFRQILVRSVIQRKVTIKKRNASGGWESLTSGDTIQADTQYAVEIFVNAKTGYTYTGLTGDKVTVNGKKASEFEKNPSTQPGVDMRVFHELEVLKVVKKVDHIEITTPPTKTVYKGGDKFDPKGMVVTAVYKDGTSEPITNYSIFHGDKLTKGQEYVTIQYDDGSGNSDIKVRQTITVGAYEGPHTHTYAGSPWYQDATNHWHQCTDSTCPDPRASATELASHTFVWKVDQAATTTQTGLKHKECTVCSYKRSENTVIPMLSGSGTATPGTTIPGTTGGTTGAAKSPKTGDAGIALYAGLSLLALSGSGWVVGKKHRGEK